MSDTMKPKKRWFLKTELVILVCVVCIWVVKSVRIDIASVKAGVLKQVVKVDPDNIDAYHFLAEYYTDEGRYEEAITAYNKATQLEPDWSWPHICLAFTYKNLRRYNEAIQEWKQVISLEPNVAGFHLLLGNAYLQIGDEDLALEEYKILKTENEKLANELLALINQLALNNQYIYVPIE